MTILSVVQDAAPSMGIAVPSALYSETDRTSVEIRGFIKLVVEDIFKRHDWEALRKVATFTGDGSATSFSLPSDYDRMVVGSKMWSSELDSQLRHVISSDEWLELQVRSWDFVTGAWHKVGGAIEILPAPANAATVKFYYVKNTLVASGTKTAFSEDADTFDLDEPLLRLGLIAKWRQKKGYSYEEEMTDYEARMADLTGEDGGDKTIRLSTQRVPKGVRIAYPRPISA